MCYVKDLCNKRRKEKILVTRKLRHKIDPAKPVVQW